MAPCLPQRLASSGDAGSAELTRALIEAIDVGHSDCRTGLTAERGPARRGEMLPTVSGFGRFEKEELLSGHGVSMRGGYDNFLRLAERSETFFRTRGIVRSMRPIFRRRKVVVRLGDGTAFTVRSHDGLWHHDPVRRRSPVRAPRMVRRTPGTWLYRRLEF